MDAPALPIMVYDAIFYSQVSNPHINKGHEFIFQLPLLLLSQANFQVNFLRQHLLLLLTPMLLPLARGTVCGCPCLESERVPWAFWLKEAATTLLFLTVNNTICYFLCSLLQIHPTISNELLHVKLSCEKQDVTCL